MVRRTALLLAAALTGALLAAVPGPVTAADAAPGTVLRAHRVIRPGVLHDQRSYQAYFEVAGYPGEIRPAALEMRGISTGAAVIHASYESPCLGQADDCTPVWRMWVPLVKDNGEPPARGWWTIHLTLHSSDGTPREFELGEVVRQYVVRTSSQNTTTSLSARIPGTSRVGACSRLRIPGRYLERRSIGLYSQTSCRRLQGHADVVRQRFQIAAPALVSADRIYDIEATFRISGHRVRGGGRLRIDVRSTTNGSRQWQRCFRGVAAGAFNCSAASDAGGGVRSGPLQLRVTVQRGARVDVGKVGVLLIHDSWLTPDHP